MRHLIFALALLLPVAAQAQVAAPTPGGSPVMGVTFKPKGTMRIAAFLREVDGRIAVCGIWATGPDISPYIKSSGFPRRTLGGGSVRVGGKTVVRGLTFFREVEDAAFDSGTMAHCEVTRFRWSPGLSHDALEIVITSIRGFG